MKARSFCARAFTSIGFVAVFALAMYGQDARVSDELGRSFRRFEVARIETGKELRSEGQRKRISVQAEGRRFELVVEPNDLRSTRYRAEDSNVVGMTPVEQSDVATYKGSIDGEPISEVRLTINGSKIEGFFETPGRRLYIEPASKHSSHASPNDVIIYHAEDSLIDTTFICESDVAGKLELGTQFVEPARTEGVVMVRFIELATEADLEFVTTMGGPAAANSEILGILNMIEGTYNTELGLSIRVVYQHTWSTADPYNAADMTGILDAFVNHWNASFGNIARDAAHLWTAKTPARSRGLAYVGVICRFPSAAYGLSGYVGTAPGKFLVSAHEIGHNLGAEHVDATQNCASSIMNASLNNTIPLSFCTFSRDVITTYVTAYGSCLSDSAPLPTPTPTATPVPTPTATPIPTPTPLPPAAGQAVFDFDGDGRSDVSVFRPTNGVWYINGSSSGFSAFAFGLNIDKPVAADYDGDGRADAAVYRNGVWYRLKSATNTSDVINFGLVGDVPTAADLDGDSRADLVVFRPSTGTWYSMLSSSGAVTTVRFGLAGDIPVPGDYDGDGRDDINLFRPANGTWYRLNSSTGGFASTNFGLNGDKPVAGDFDGDGRADLAVWRPSTGVWYAMLSASGSLFANTFGLAGDIPTAADYDGDGRSDAAVFRPSSGTWYRLNSSNSAYVEVRFGLAGDIPMPGYYVP